MQAYLREYGAFLFLGILFTAPVIRKLEEKCSRSKAAFIPYIAEPVICAVLFLWAVSFLILGAHNPFIYFNF